MPQTARENPWGLTITVWVSVSLTSFAVCAGVTPSASLPKTSALLRSAGRPVRVVGFGDSITGVYYHTGSRRAWPALLGLALQRAPFRAKVETVNAGISGNTTRQALRRIKRDVLQKRPDLVVVMFGMNDVARTPIETYAANLRRIVALCRGVGAEVVLCTPNSIYPTDKRRSVARLAEFAAGVRAVAKEMKVPLADCYASYERLRAKDRVAWQLLMSETIHPNLTGHQRFAEVMASAIAGKKVSLGDLRTPEPMIPRTLARVAKGEAINVVAMEPYDEIVPRVIAKLNPKIKVNVTRWPARGQSLAQIVRWARSVRRRKPDLVVVAVPREALPTDASKLIRSYSWALNWSLRFGKPTWDVIALAPSVTKPGPATKKDPRDDLVRKIALGKDVPLIERSPGDDASPEALLLRWFRERQAAAKRIGSAAAR